MEKWFSKGLQKWYDQNKRDLPWRNERDPYRIWLSEIILQQTQVKQGLSYYLKFIKNYPTIKHLAKASEDQILKDWQGLGYYSRARNLHFAAKSIVSGNNGYFPENYEEIMSLKGIGAYTAAAIASFAFNMPHAVVDGNVYRLLSRVFGISRAIDSAEGKKEFQALASGLMDTKQPAAHNQAIMEFGSQFCKPANPDCNSCIFKSKCYAFGAGSVSLFPVKSKKIKVVSRYFNYLVLVDKNKDIAVNKRMGNDIWKGLYEFCLIESPADIMPAQLFELKEFKEASHKNLKVLHASKTYKHILTHQNLYAKFYVIKLDFTHTRLQSRSKAGTLGRFAFPRLIEKFLNDCNLAELY
jgi:A/G-specific adenine glycosylase